MSEMITIYQGRNVEELTREELLVAVKALGRMLSLQHDIAKGTAEIICLGDRRREQAFMALCDVIRAHPSCLA